MLLFQEQLTQLSPDSLVELGLSRREAEVLVWVARGKTDREIADILELSPRTVQTHLSSIFAKLDVNSRTEAIIAAMRLGIISSGMPERG